MSRKHKHRKHKCWKGGNQHQCGGNCQCNKVASAEITTEIELWALINLITNQGRKREIQQLITDDELSNAMLADVQNEVPTNTENPVALLLTNGETTV